MAAHNIDTWQASGRGAERGEAGEGHQTAEIDEESREGGRGKYRKW